jgi:hypothetical protein
MADTTLPRENEKSSAPDFDEIDWGPAQRSLDDGEPCPECGYEFNADEWDVRHLYGGAWAGESWVYECPNCEQETCIIST